MEDTAQEAHDDDSNRQASSSLLQVLLVKKAPAAATAAAVATITTMKDDAHLMPTGKSPSPNTKQAKIVTTTTDQKVKELGKKTRSRFVQERSKRPEIKRLETAPVPATAAALAAATTKPTTTAAAKSRGTAGKNNQQAPSSPPRKRKRASTTSKKNRGPTTTAPQQQQQQDDEKIVDYWLPDISKLQPFTTTTKKEDRSNCVRLHGLPLNTTAAHIQTFFRGLNPERIVLLPSLNNQLIPTWDALPSTPPVTTAASPSPPPKKRQGQERHHHHHHLVVERYPFHFRVLVKFQSAPTAALAVDRSGELLTMTTTIHNINKNNGDDNYINGDGRGGSLKKVTTAAAAIAVTHVPKSEASYLLRHLVIDADSSSSSSTTSSTTTTLETTLARIEQTLGQEVIFLLWIAAKHHLQLTSVDLSLLATSSLSATSTTATGLASSLLFSDNLTRIKKSRQILAKQRNQLLELYHRLLSPADYQGSSCCLLDPELLALDPILRLTLNAANFVMDQVKRIDECLLIMTRLQQNQFSFPLSKK